MVHTAGKKKELDDGGQEARPLRVKLADGRQEALKVQFQVKSNDCF
jgi:ferric-dicitrate binding protein FerR (iron transport regulator)